jgi:hypothetical protein
VKGKSSLPPAFTVPKVEGQRNEDRYQRSSKGVFALSDGASISFDSAAWARILVRRFAQEPEFSREWLSAAIAEFGKLHDRESLPWMQQASFDKGSFASLLGVRILDENRLIQVLAIGDSLAVLCDGDRIKCTFPYSTALQFEQSPQLLCTNLAENAFLNNADRSDELYADWTFGGLEQPALLCMTDALGQWLLSWKEPDQSAIAILRNIRTQGEFARFVRTERKAGRHRRDDTTLIALWVAP